MLRPLGEAARNRVVCRRWSACTIAFFAFDRACNDASRGMRRSPVPVSPGRYLPPADLTTEFLNRSDRRSFCEWRGHDVYWHLARGDVLLPDVGWTYSAPPASALVRDHAALYAAPSSHSTVDGEQVNPQPGDFHGDGSLTADGSRPISLAPSGAYPGIRDGDAGAARRSAEGDFTCSAER